MDNNNYTKMQINDYTGFANTSGEKVLGNPEEKLNDWPHWETLFDGMELSNKVGLDFGCGPGRNIALFGKRFKQLDGIDLSQRILDRAKERLQEYPNPYQLFLCNGTDLSIIPDETYDIIMSTIALQHICVHEIRFNYFTEFYRILKPTGWITIQMGYGHRHGAVGYYENKYDATATNGATDVSIANESQVRDDLQKIGFRNFSYTLTDTHPTDIHEKWIFFRAEK